MADGELIDMASQFKGLPMADLIGGPLRAACDAQIALANATATFVKVVGFKPPTEGDDATPWATFARPSSNSPGRG